LYVQTCAGDQDCWFPSYIGKSLKETNRLHFGICLNLYLIWRLFFI
jgi:hypothetical protein